MIWDYFIYFALLALLLWVAGAWLGFKERSRGAYVATGAGLAVFFVYIVLMWSALDRPPMRTMGETRLWYAFFLPLAGLLVYNRWKYRWILSFSALMAGVFICINLFKPEIHSKSLMPALQSPWFAPHVIVYMLAYALLGAAFLVAAFQLLRAKTISDDALDMCDGMVNVGWSLLTIGMLFGAFWAKDAWGTYWAWDPKETWAAASWLSYLVYIHLRLRPNAYRKLSLWVIVINFVVLQMCWWGINYLPAAQGASIHTYSMG